MMTEDLATFFDLTEFGESATVGSTTVLGMFSREFVVVGNVEGYYPIFYCATGAITKGASVILRGVTYKAISARPDGTGVDVVILEDQ